MILTIISFLVAYLILLLSKNKNPLLLSSVITVTVVLITSIVLYNLPKDSRVINYLYEVQSQDTTFSNGYRSLSEKPILECSDDSLIMSSTTKLERYMVLVDNNYNINNVIKTDTTIANDTLRNLIILNKRVYKKRFNIIFPFPDLRNGGTVILYKK